MPPAPQPSNEQERAQAAASCLRQHRVEEHDGWLSDLTRVVGTLTGCPISLVSIVAETTQVFLARRGLAVSSTPRDQAFCAYTILQDGPLVVEDATADARFADNPLVKGEPGIRFYAGVPLINSRGLALGTLCAIHTKPHSLSKEQVGALRVLGRLISEHLEASERARELEGDAQARRVEAEELNQAKAALEEELRRRDLLERAVAEQALAREEAERLVLHQQHALDTAGIVAVTDRSGTIQHVNDNFCRISGYAREELIGRNHRILNSGFHPKSFFKAMYAQIGRGEPWRGEICNRSKSGELYWVDTTIVPMLDREGRVHRYIALRIDVTARKRAEAELVLARQAAESANRAKSEFLANMSHEIRTPLTAILGYADLLRDEADGGRTPQQRVETIDTIRSAGQHLLTVINDLLDLSKIEAGRMTVERVETPLTRIIGEVADLIRPRLLGKGVALDVRFETPLPATIISDPTRLRQLLLNVAGNASKFTEAGRVSIRAGETVSGRLRIDVEDTGPGLTAEQAVQLFAPFSQGDATVTRRHGGTGLGLTISRRLADLMGGTVALSWTEPGRGSCFRIELPLTPAPGAKLVDKPEAAPQPDQAGPEAPARLSGRVLLVEDGPDNQRLISHHLRRAGSEVDIASHGVEALSRIEEAGRAGRPYDLVLTDVQMPEMDGYSLARAIRGRGMTVPIVALTAHAMPEDRDRCLEAGCNDYASKPIDRASLLRTCAKWMARGAERRAA